MSDPVLVSPGMKIAYQVQIGDGQMIAYEAAVDADATRPELDSLFDRMGGAAQRMQAKIDLPLRRASLEQNRNALSRLERELAQAVSARDANYAVVNRNRNREVPPRPDLINAVSQAQSRLNECRYAIESGEAYIPYLEAIVRGEDAQPPAPATRTWDREPEPMGDPVRLEAAE